MVEEPVGEGNPVRPGGPGTAPRGQYHPDGRVRGSAQPLPGRCGRRLRGSDPPRYCKQYPLRGRDACKYCGGKSPAGVGHYNFRDGRFSRYVPRDLRKAYARAHSDPELLSLRDDIALMETRQAELLKRMSQAPPPWAEALNLFREVSAASDPDSQARCLGRLGEVLQQGRDAHAVTERAWRELRELIREKTQTARAEWKRLHDLDALVTAEQALALVMLSLDAAKEVIEDKSTLRRFSEKVLALLPPPEAARR
jgi:hypothetical protein